MKLLLFFLATPLLAQVAAPNDASQIIDQFQRATIPWLTTGEQVASGLFGILATIEFGITIGMLAFAQADVTVWGATLVRKFMTVGAFYALLLLGPPLMQQIIDSYVRFGSMASGVPSITAGDILADGIDIAARLLISAVLSGLSMSLVAAPLMLLCAFVIGWSFVKLVKGFVMAKIESFITIYASVIQLGWGASRFTSIYAERYVAAAMATGVKLMVFYFIVGVERVLAPGWIAAAKSAPLSIAGIIPTITLTMSVVLFCSLAEPEKLVANIFAGQPQFTGHDVTNTYMPYANTGITLASSAINLGVGQAIAPLISSATSAAPAGSTAMTVSAKPNNQSTPPPRRP